MRKLCPKCNRYTLAYDGNREIERCFGFFCDYVEEDKNSKVIEIKRNFDGKKRLVTV